MGRVGDWKRLEVFALFTVHFPVDSSGNNWPWQVAVGEKIKQRKSKRKEKKQKRR